MFVNPAGILTVALLIPISPASDVLLIVTVYAFVAPADTAVGEIVAA
jgi:hypothetical protein